MVWLPGSREVEWVDKAKGSGTGGTSGRQVAGEVAPELCVLVNAAKEDLLILIFKGKVQSLCGKVTDYISEVTTPVSGDTLLFGDSDEAIDYTYNQNIHFTFSLVLQNNVFYTKQSTLKQVSLQFVNATNNNHNHQAVKYNSTVDLYHSLIHPYVYN